LIASALCSPVMAGGIRPLPENLEADEIPDCCSHARLKEISLALSA
jgi:hypothetical protein